MYSKSYLFLQLCYFLTGPHDLLLHNGLFLLKFSQLFLQMVIFILLHGDLIGQRLEIRHNQRVHDFDILIIDCL